MEMKSKPALTPTLPPNRGTIPGSAGVSPASSGFRLPTGRRDASAPRRFMERAGVYLASVHHLKFFTVSTNAVMFSNFALGGTP